ncbi:MAG: transcriptional regulator [Bacteroides sp.]|nr:transcriptional regulator [Bacteroides sp.]
MMRNTLSLRILLAILLIYCTPCRADWNNFIVNFDKSLYGRGTQTWQIAPYDEKWAFFANKNGLVQLDGNTWQTFALNNRSDVRSVYPSKSQKRVFVGGINEFGYFEPGKDGLLEYHCISDTLKDEIRLLGNVWQIFETENILYFQGDNKIVKCLNGKHSVIEMEGKIECSALVNGILYVGTNRGIWMLVGNTFFPLQGSERLNTLRFRSIVPYKEGILVATDYNGLFYCDGYSAQQVETGAEVYMRENEVFCMAKQGDKIALGTIHGGLLLIDLASGQIECFDENNGLQNNTVLSLAFDAVGNLWAGLDSGMDYVYLNSPFTNLYTYPHSYGSGYTAFQEGKSLYLGTNRGLYRVDYPVVMKNNLPLITSVPYSSGQVWNLCKVGDELFCLHDRGLFLIQDNKLERVTDLTGVWCCQQVVGHADKMYVGAYEGLYLLKKEQGKWRMECRIRYLDDSCRLFEQETDRVLWICNSDNVVRLELNMQLNAVDKRKEYRETEGLSSTYDVSVAKIEGGIYFTTAQGVYKYNRFKDIMEPAPEINSLLSGVTSYTRLREYNGKLIGLSTHEVCVSNLGTYKRGVNSIVYPIHQSLIEYVDGFEAIVPLNDSLVIIPNEGGFSLFNVYAEKTKHNRENSLSIKNMYLSYPKDSLVYSANYLNKKVTPEIDYTLNSVRFEYGIPLLVMGDEIRFQYRMNEEPWSDFTTTHTKEYSNLSEGDYQFQVKALFPDGTISMDSISFSILPPWYKSTSAYICYLLLTIFFLWCVYRWDDVRVRRKKEQVAQEKEQEMHALEQVYEEESARQKHQIMQLEKEKLEYDLKHKSQEIANLMINTVRKNEMLTNVKSEIAKVIPMLKGEGAREGRQHLLLINNKIDSTIQSDDVLKRIEEQFDLIHNNFMERLRTKHPNLSNGERIMCAYLQMGLSTKEIAPLMNISVRGVETLRYRLRKKFELPREESLTDYLANRL